MADSVVAALFGALGGIVVSLVGWLASLSVQNRAAQNSADLAARESSLRLQSEVRLRLHDKSWGLLREIVLAIYECHDALHGAVHDVAKNTAERESARKAALQVVVRLETPAASAPPQANLTEMRATFKQAMRTIVAWPKNAEEPAAPFIADVSTQLGNAMELGKQSIAKWNDILWRDAPNAAKPLQEKSNA